ncbi:MAG: hypothetical protein WCA46_07380 [Actinocatenispora sp.]
MVNSSWRDLPEPARGIAEATGDAVRAARAADDDAYREATARLAAAEPEQVGIVTGAAVRLLLEDTHPDGLTADDLRAVLTRCVTSAVWFTALDPTVPGILVAGALGVHESDGERLPLTGPAVAAHAPLLLASLATGAEHPLEVYLRAALADIERAETMEMP